jgi:hypothetical protein
MALMEEDPKDVALALLLGWRPTAQVPGQTWFEVHMEDDWCRPTRPDEDPNFGVSDDRVWALKGFAYGGLKDVLAYDLPTEVAKCKQLTPEVTP